MNHYTFAIVRHTLTAVGLLMSGMVIALTVFALRTFIVL